MWLFKSQLLFLELSHMCMDQWPFQNGNDEYDNDDDDIHGSFMNHDSHGTQDVVLQWQVRVQELLGNTLNWAFEITYQFLGH